MSSPSPPPPASNPSPLTIGRTFLKQYYNILTTNPDMIYKFYRPSSVLSHGEGSNPTTPTTMESLGESPAAELKNRFFSWAADSSAPVRFELEHGAIDAQESVGGGVLLVVTGHMYLGDSRKSFCHTFFLDLLGDSKKRQYYVHNDVLRFLQEEAPLKESALTAVVEEEEEEAAAEIEQEQETAIGASDDEPEKLKVEKRDVNPQENSTCNGTNNPLVQNLDESDAGSSQEIKVADSADEYVANVEEVLLAAAATAVGKAYINEGEEKEEVGEPVLANQDSSDLSPPSESSNSKRAGGGSWAMIARSGVSGSTSTTTANTGGGKVVNTPSSPDKPVNPTKSSMKKDKKELLSETISKGSEHKQSRYKRDPESTLVIKNVPDGTKEADIRVLFEPFAINTKARIIGITVAHRGLAFVDYDSTAPVLAALEKKDQFFLNQKALDVGQKNKNNKGNNSNNNNHRSHSNSRRSGNNQRQRNNNGFRDRGGSGRNNNNNNQQKSGGIHNKN